MTNEVLDSGSDSDCLPRDATEDEIRTLPRVVDKIPLAAWAAAFVGSAERFSYYCIISIWREFSPLMLFNPEVTFSLFAKSESCSPQTGREKNDIFGRH